MCSGTTLVPAPERTSITLTCPHDVGASHVPTWSRDSGGIPLRRFDVSPVDQTLTITDVQPGDSGLYYCDGKPAVYLNVIKGKKKEIREKHRNMGGSKHILNKQDMMCHSVSFRSVGK